MVTLTPEQFDHAIRVISLLCFVSGIVGALALNTFLGVAQHAIAGIVYLIDRRARIDMSRKRAQSLRRAGERFVKVADRMDARARCKAEGEGVSHGS